MKTAIILLGAGFPMIWGGSSTEDITKEIINSREFLTTDGKSLAGYIQDILAEHHMVLDKRLINFEHIINALESLCEYYEDLYNQGTLPQFSGSRSAWFGIDNKHQCIENYTYKEQANGKGYLYNKAKSGDSPWVQIDEGHHKRFYLCKVLEHYFLLIKRCIARYDYIDNINQIKYKQINSEFISFIKALKNKGYSLRICTTNYDELIPSLFKINGLDLFCGFTTNKSGVLFPDVKKILEENQIDTCFSLHGNIRWKLEYDYDFDRGFSYVPNHWASENEFIGEYTNPSKRTLINSIVTGFDKLEKTSIQPLKSFFERLSFDSIQSDIVISVGYSYGDPHINKSLFNAMKYNEPNTLHITKNDNFFGSLEYINMQRSILRKRKKNDYNEINNLYMSSDSKSQIYAGGFERFLLDKVWHEVVEKI